MHRSARLQTWLNVLVLALASSAVACSSEGAGAGDAGPGDASNGRLDAGPVDDAGPAPGIDAARLDAGDGAAMDAGRAETDAGTPDAGGPARDAGFGSDANVAASDGGITPAEIEGYWSSTEWGDMVFRVVGDELWGAYVHDQGTVRGRVVDGHFTGWWCEVPSRMGPNDAGDVVFDFIRDEDGGTLRFDGHWRYAYELPGGAFRENWDLAKVGGAEPAELVERFVHPEAFCPTPSP